MIHARAPIAGRVLYSSTSAFWTLLRHQLRPARLPPGRHLVTKEMHVWVVVNVPALRRLACAPPLVVALYIGTAAPRAEAVSLWWASPAVSCARPPRNGARQRPSLESRSSSRMASEASVSSRQWTVCDHPTSHFAVVSQYLCWAVALCVVSVCLFCYKTPCWNDCYLRHTKLCCGVRAFQVR